MVLSLAAWTLLHEFGHLDHTVNPKLVDNAWGGAACAALAEEDAESAIENADNWMFAAMGVSPITTVSFSVGHF